MPKMSFTLPKPAPKTAAKTNDKMVAGPFETTTAAGRSIRWAIVETPDFGTLYHVEPDNKQPLRMGASKADIWSAVFTDAVKRNI